MIVHCLFEQSGVFKNEFKRLGYDAFDYDSKNDYKETDVITDIFKSINEAYLGKKTLFDSIKKDDLMIVFFPCTFFSESSQMYFTNNNCYNYRRFSTHDICNSRISRDCSRSKYYKILLKLFCIVQVKGLRMILENPYHKTCYLYNNFIAPTIIDNNRRLRGDYFVRPTGYWFVNIEPTNGCSFQQPTELKVVRESKHSKKQGDIQDERNLISPDYARNFICDFILGKTQKNITQLEFNFNDNGNKD